MQTFKSACFYFSPHADDWQLFMDPEAGRSMADKQCKTVLIHVTAGDAGLDEKYWKARESAAIESVLFRMSADGYLHRGEAEWEDLHKRRHRSVVINNCSCYFLRLPDGGYDGLGYPGNGQHSLDRFRKKEVGHLQSVDQQCLYTDWQDLAGMLDELIEWELSQCLISKSAADVCLNIPEDDPGINPFDHNDHYNTSLLVKRTRAHRLYSTKAFLTYHLKNSSRLLSGEDLFWKIGLFSSYHQCLFREFGHSTLLEDESFIPWCMRDSVHRNL